MKGPLKRGFALMLLLNLWSSPALSDPITVDQLIQMADGGAARLQALNEEVGALEAEIRARDRVLSPVVGAELLYDRDGRDRTASNGTQQGTTGSLVSSLSQPFATGTDLSFSVGHSVRGREEQERDNSVAAWEVRLSQSLLRDSFGRATALRWRAEAAELQSRRYGLLAERQEIAISLEEGFWDLLLAIRETEIREATIQRSLDLERWMKGRVDSFAAEEADLVQVRTLLSERRLDLLIASRARAAARSKIQQIVPSIDPDGWQIDPELLAIKRPLTGLLAAPSESGAERHIQIAALAAAYRSDQLSAQSEIIEENLLPELTAFASFGANGVRNPFDDSWGRAISGEANATQVGLLFSVELDRSLKDQERISARLRADAARSRSRALTAESDVLWKELSSETKDLATQIAEARRLVALQRKKVAMERERFEQGKSTTFQLTTFEVDLSESEFRLSQLYAALRKAEARARQFIAADGVDR
jgi:outer membrane protein TolC